MTTVVIVAMVLTTLTAALVPGRFRRWLLWIGGLGLAVGLAGAAFLAWGPRDYLTRWPFLAGVLHPYQIVLYAALGAFLGASAWLGLAARHLIRASWPTRGRGDR